MVETDYPSDCALTEGLRQRAADKNQPLVRSEAWQAVLPKGQAIKLLLLDVDGVLTDGCITYIGSQEESKTFHTKDGFGLRVLQETGIEVGLITARKSAVVARRAQELSFAHLYQGCQDKQVAFQAILEKTSLRPREVAYMGDDWLDIPLLDQVGLSAAPADAVPEVLQRVDYCCERLGGRGAVRELCDLLLEATGQRAALLRRYCR